MKKSAHHIKTKTSINNDMIMRWLHKYKENEIEGLKNKRKLGNQ